MARRTETEVEAAITSIEEVLDSGASTVAQDGHTTVFDRRSLQVRLRQLRNELSELQGTPKRRPFFNRIDLS